MCSGVQRQIQLDPSNNIEGNILYIGFDYNDMSAQNFTNLQGEGEGTINQCKYKCELGLVCIDSRTE